MPEDDAASDILHASAVAMEGRGLLILGRSGSGKSSLALELIAIGATLVADDRVVVTPGPGGKITLSSPDTIAGLVEARGIGLLRLPHVSATLHAVVDLDLTEAERLPPAREIVISGRSVACLRRVETPAFAAMVGAYLRGGRHAP